MTASAPTEAKVWAGTAGSGVGAALSAFLLWAFGVGFWGAASDAGHAADAIAAVPFPVAAVVGLGVTGAGTFAAGWWAKHTPRSSGESHTAEHAAPDGP